MKKKKMKQTRGVRTVNVKKNTRGVWGGGGTENVKRKHKKGKGGDRECERGGRRRKKGGEGDRE